MGALGSAFSAARVAGRAMVCDDLDVPVTALLTAMTTAAASGKKTFEYRALVAFQPADIRLGGSLYTAMSSGIAEGLAAQDILSSEYTIELDTSDNTSTYIIITFSF